MNNILHDSNLKITTLVETFFKKALISQNNSYALTDFTDNLQEILMEIGKNVTKEVILTVEEAIFESEKRKKEYTCIDNIERDLITIFGILNFKRRYYQNIKNKNEKKYLTDNYLDILDKERMLKNVEEKLIINSITNSYESAGNNASYSEKISKQTVKNKISKLKFNVIPYQIPKEKRKKTNIYVQADEDHVSLQTGGISIPKIVTIHEGSENGKLMNKYTISGLYESNTDSLWEYVLTYLEDVYDYEYIKTIYVLGDGATWIKSSLAWLPKSKYIADKFHIFKSINMIAGNDKGIRELLRDSIFKLDFDEFEANCETIIELEKNLSKKLQLHKTMKYILNNKIGIKRFILWDLPGCSAEGQVSHVLSDRLSSRPLGWCKQNIDNMSRLRAMKFNDEDIKIITRNRQNLSEEENKQLDTNENIRIKLKKSINKKINMTTYTIPELIYGDKECRMKLKEIINY